MNQAFISMNANLLRQALVLYSKQKLFPLWIVSSCYLENSKGRQLPESEL